MDQKIEPMEVEEILADDYNFDELIDIDLKNNDSKRLEPRETLTYPETRYENKGAVFTTGIDIFSQEEKQKIEERAKRFGLNDKEIFSRLEEYQYLYSSMGITEENENTKKFRLNVLHIRGTEKMSTKDVFKYFEDYAPASIEWINDVSCNVVWMDSASAARALVGLSKKIVGMGNRTRINLSPKSNDSNNEGDIEIDAEDKNEENNDKMDQDIISEKEIDAKNIDYPLPPGIWRKGIDCPNSKGLFMRFAMISDKKQPRAEKMSQYYKKYGNPNFGGVRGILTESRKRSYRETTQSRKRTKENLPGEDEKGTSKNPWGDLSQTWGVNDTLEDDFIQKFHIPEQTTRIKERLGSRNRSKETPPVSEESDSESASDSEEEWCKKSKVPRMRMHADDEEEKMQKRRSKLHTKLTISTTNDLRSRLGRTRKEPVREAIQIVVTNPSIRSYETSKVVESEEEGEIVDSENEEQEVENNEESEVEDEEVVEEEEEEEDVEEEEGEVESDEDSEVSEKEVRGPKGSVIKVVANKPRVASTVWTRLNHTSVKSEVKAVNNDKSPLRDLRETLKGDLRSRLGKHTRGRSPLRIEVKNEKCADDITDSE